MVLDRLAKGLAMVTKELTKGSTAVGKAVYNEVSSVPDAIREGFEEGIFDTTTGSTPKELQKAIIDKNKSAKK